MFSKHSDLASCCCSGSFAVGRFFVFCCWFPLPLLSLPRNSLDTRVLPGALKGRGCWFDSDFFFLAIKSCFILPASTESGLLCVSVFEKRGLWVQSTPGCGRLKGYCFILCRKHVQSQGGENSPLIKRHGTGGLPKSKSSWKDEPFVPEALT